MNRVKLIAFDLDGTLTQHRSALEDVNRNILEILSRQYRLVMVGAGDCMRIFNQMGNFPIDIIGNYGMQCAVFDYGQKKPVIVSEVHIEPERASVTERIEMLRSELGFTDYRGDTVEFHDSGMVTFPLIGTEALLADKLAFDPDRKKRRPVYSRVAGVFDEFNVFVGGSSSFDMAPKPYCKSYALKKYAEARNISMDEIVYFGDDYLPGGNDADVVNSGVKFVGVDDYRRFGEYVRIAGLI